MLFFFGNIYRKEERKTIIREGKIDRENERKLLFIRDAIIQGGESPFIGFQLTLIYLSFKCK